MLSCARVQADRFKTLVSGDLRKLRKYYLAFLFRRPAGSNSCTPCNPICTMVGVKISWRCRSKENLVPRMLRLQPAETGDRTVTGPDRSPLAQSTLDPITWCPEALSRPGYGGLRRLRLPNLSEIFLETSFVC